MKLTNEDIILIYKALQKLDNSNPEPALRPDPPVKLTGKGIYAIGRNLRLLRDPAEELEKTRNMLVLKQVAEQSKDPALGKDKDGKVKEYLERDSIYGKAYFDEYTKILEETEEIDLHAIKTSWLKLDENNIASGTIQDLIPILEDDSDAAPVSAPSPAPAASTPAESAATAKQ